MRETQECLPVAVPPRPVQALPARQLLELIAASLPHMRPSERVAFSDVVKELVE